MTDHGQPVEARIQQRLAEDPRTHELGIEASVQAEVVYLRGEVAAEERRRTVADVAAETADGREIRNEITVLEVHEPTEEELS